MNKISVVVLILIFSSLGAQGQDFRTRLFGETPVDNLSLNLISENWEEADSLLLISPELVDFRESQLGHSLLIWATIERSSSIVKFLLKHGAAPNLRNNAGGTALFYAADGPRSFLEEENDKNNKNVKLLLSYGANPLIPYCNSDPIPSGGSDMSDCGTTPLMNVNNLFKAKAIANVLTTLDHKDIYGRTAVVKAFWLGDPTRINVLHFLIVEGLSYKN